MGREDDLDELVRQYADAERSDTFVSYNNAIILARAVRRLQRVNRRLRRKLK